MEVASSSNKPQRILQSLKSCENCCQDKKKEMEQCHSIEHKQQDMDSETEDALLYKKKKDHITKERRFEIGNNTIKAVCANFGLSEIKLIKSVRKHQDLYNQSHTYRSKQCLDAWEKVAIENNNTAINCRETWKLIRRQYIFFKKNKTLLNFYLAEHMGFIDTNTRNEIYTSKIKGNPGPSVSTHVAQINQPVINNISKIAKEDAEHRIRFLMSLLSDVRNMNYSQMNNFKKRVYRLIGETLKIR